MGKLKVAILGVGSIGQYHAREFDRLGANVVAILARTKKSAEEKTRTLKQLYGITANAYSDLNELLDNERLDIVSVCTSPKVHSKQVGQCLENNTHVLCEKPLVFDSISNNYAVAKGLFKLASDKDRTLSVNTQLVSLLECLSLEKARESKYFSIYMEPPDIDKLDLMVAAVPHMNSFLIKLFRFKKIKNVGLRNRRTGGLIVTFEYGTQQIEYIFGVKRERPRQFYFALDGVKYEKVINDKYEQKLVFNRNSIKVEDPLSVSIKRFIDCCNGDGEPLVSEEESKYNIELQDTILGEYISAGKFLVSNQKKSKLLHN